MKKIKYLPILILVIIFSCSKEKVEEISVNKFEDYAGSQGDVIAETKEEVSTEEETSTLERITTKQVKAHIGDSLFIEGFVADIFMTDKVAYLNFDNKFPKNTIAGTIFANKFSEFGDLGRFKNKRVEMRGKISTYKNKPQIILQSKDQIRIIN
jgi:hypothetical protein